MTLMNMLVMLIIIIIKMIRGMNVELLLNQNIEGKVIQKLLYNCYVIQQEKMV